MRALFDAKKKLVNPLQQVCDFKLYLAQESGRPAAPRSARHRIGPRQHFTVARLEPRRR